MYIPHNWAFSSALSELRDFGRGVEPPNPPPPWYAAELEGVKKPNVIVLSLTVRTFESVELFLISMKQQTLFKQRKDII
jgi:hypothetical protein